MAGNVSTTDHAATGTALGTTRITENNEPAIPLTEKPARHSRIFGRGKKAGTNSIEEQTVTRSNEPNDVSGGTLLSTGAYGYGNNEYRYGNGMSRDTGAWWAGAGTIYPEYEPGQSGVDPGGYAHGYEEPADTKPQYDSRRGNF